MPVLASKVSVCALSPHLEMKDMQLCMPSCMYERINKPLQIQINVSPLSDPGFRRREALDTLCLLDLRKRNRHKCLLSGHICLDP